MGQTRKPMAGDIYRHFKDKLYEVITIAIHSETEEEMVVYRQMYGNMDTYVRPLSMFLSEVDHNKYPQVKQKYRFERIGALQRDEETEAVFQKAKATDAMPGDVSYQKDIPQNSLLEDSNECMDFLIRFLDARTYGEKLAVLEEITCELDDKTINNMALSMDIVIEEGSVENRLAELKECIRTKAKYECFRLH